MVILGSADIAFGQTIQYKYKIICRDGRNGGVVRTSAERLESMRGIAAVAASIRFDRRAL